MQGKNTKNTDDKQLSFETVKEKARGRWKQILMAAGIDEQYLTGRHSPCPVCGGRDRFRFTDRDGRGSFICEHCNGKQIAGDGFTLVQRFRRCSAKESFAIVDEILNGNSAPVPVATVLPCETVKSDHTEQVERIWNESRPIESGDIADRYLRITRGLKLTSVRHLRFHRSLPYWIRNDDGTWQIKARYPALVAAISDVDGRLVGVHRTFLTLDGRKAPEENPKRMKACYDGSTKGAAIRLFPTATKLGVAEGVETAVACATACEIPVWAAMSAGNMELLRVPDYIREIVIFADRDSNGRGQFAAKRLAARLLEEDRLVKIVTPPTTGKDWCDYVTEAEVPNE